MSAHAGLVGGVLERHPKGHGLLRNLQKNLTPKADDPVVPGAFVERYNLADGLYLIGRAGPAQRGGGPRLESIETIEGVPAAEFRRREWDELTAIDPQQHLKLETTSDILTTRVIDLFTPIGKGQRGLIVAPPRAGKTVLLAHIAQAIATNHPDMHLMIVLVDERPEEVTEMRRLVKSWQTTPERAVQYELLASSSDSDTPTHIRMSQLAVERAKRLAEMGKDVFLLLDSLTRLARAFNKHAGNSGRTLSGGVDSRALEIPKRLFGSARAFEEGGSLTILGTVLVETGSRMDDVIFQEFKGTGNMELVLDRKLAEKRVYPAVDLGQSGTRKEERILPPETLERVTLLRKSLAKLRSHEAAESLMPQLAKTRSNEEFLQIIGKFTS